jgi:molybdopterin-guanine dinucleotide biosynthesis protein A
MGRDKAWLEVAGEPLIRRQIRIAREIGATEVLISGRPDADYTALELRVLYDQSPGLGPLAGVERGLSNASCNLVLILAVDLPRITPCVLRFLRSGCGEMLGAVPRVGQRLEPLAAFYPRAVLPLVREQLASGRYAMRDMIDKAQDAGLIRIIELEPEKADAFANWNEPPDLTADPN